VRRHVDVQVPLVTDAAGYPVVAAEIERTMDRHGFPIDAAAAPWWVRAPSRILLGLGGPSFRDYVPARLAYFRGSRLEVALYPNGLLVRGPAQDAAWAHGVLVEALSDAPAYQTFDPGAQDIERQIRSVWQVFRENPPAHRDSRRLEARLGEIARDIRALPVDYDEWQIVYRQALQLGRALHGQRQLLETSDDANGALATPAPRPAPGPAPRKDAQMAPPPNGSVNGDARALSTRELIGEITGTAAQLARKEVALARAEIRADFQSEIAMAKSLAIGATAALLGLDLLLVAGVLALAPWIAPWLSALIGGALLLVAGAIVGYVGWSRRVSRPLALTRKTLKEDVQWAKERLA